MHKMLKGPLRNETIKFLKATVKSLSLNFQDLKGNLAVPGPGQSVHTRLWSASTPSNR